MMDNSALQVCNLTVKLQIEGRIYPVVRDLSFDLKKGKTLALVGESGCGKSMTALSILRILPEPPALPPEGTVMYQGKDLLKLNNKEMRRLRGKSIGMVFQDPLSALNPVYSIGAQLLEMAHAHLDLEEGEAQSAILKVLEEVKLPSAKEVMNLYPHQLSGGMLQRVVIAMALVCSPHILIADEPTTALDVSIQSQILHLLKELQQKRGMAMLLITHDMGVVARNADEVIVMYAGAEIERGPVNTILEYPAHPYTQALFAARPNPQKPKKRLATIPGHVPRITELPEGCSFHPRCKHIIPKCKQCVPSSFELAGAQNHKVRCWLYEK